MPAAAPQSPVMDADTFLEWSMHQEERYELVDGRPVMMAGAKRRHDRIVVNLIRELGNRLRGGPCSPSTAGVASRMTRGNVRRPDVTVDCGGFEPESLASSDPAVFFEVLSPSTRGVDLIRKADEYRLLRGLKAFVIIEPARADVTLWQRRSEGEWADPVKLDALSGVLVLDAISVELPLAEIYEGVPLDA